jgi:hypothetical protein
LAGRGGRREAAEAAAHRACPRCRARRAPRQEYCVECGLLLPVVVGPIARLRGRWLRRFGWYPGDWVWLSLPALAVAISGAAISIALNHHTGAAAASTLVAPSPAGHQSGVGLARPNGRTLWPASLSGWTVVLGSYPATAGPAAPRTLAHRAAKAGLPEVGILDSSGYSSLHPGYYVVFSGIYSAIADAETALQTVHASGFGSAYSRQIAR